MELSVFKALHSLAGQSTLLDWLIIFFADIFPYLIVVLALIYLWQEKGWRARLHNLFFIGLAILLSRGIFAEIIRFFYDRQRPFATLGFDALVNHSANHAFPSGHTVFFFALAFAVLFIELGGCRPDQESGRASPIWWAGFIAAASLIGVARVVAGVHWPLDIVGGILVAFLGAYVVKVLLVHRNKGEIRDKEAASA